MQNEIEPANSTYAAIRATPTGEQEAVTYSQYNQIKTLFLHTVMVEISLMATLFS